MQLVVDENHWFDFILFLLKVLVGLILLPIIFEFIQVCKYNWKYRGIAWKSYLCSDILFLPIFLVVGLVQIILFPIVLVYLLICDSFEYR